MDYIAIIKQESAALAAAARRPGMLAGSVPACPGWSGEDLIRHIGEVQAFWAVAAREGGAQPATVPLADPGEHDVLEWFDEVRTSLVMTLTGAPPDRACWVWWSPDRADSVVEVARRQAHEAAVHRVDAESVTGPVEPIESTLAVDGVVEFCERMLGGRGSVWSGPAGVVRLASTDAGDVAVLRLGGPQPQVVALGGTAATLPSVDATVTATASDLDLWLWRRPVEVSVHGSEPLATALVDWADLD